MPHYTLLIHGGAGNIHPQRISKIKQTAYRAALHQALTAGEHILASGGDALHAVKAAVCVLEDSPLFNAGKGSVFNAQGIQEMDAAIMDGRSRAIGGVACVRRIRNPVCAAHAVLEYSSHGLLCGEGAELFAYSHHVQCAEADYFFDQHRWDQHIAIKSTKKVQLDFDIEDSLKPETDKFGTVGAVACDSRGHIAAATSTGGMTNKLPGRIGDSPLAGAGIYADDESCAVSCTGQGEFFMRGLIAADVASRMRYARLGLCDAAQAAIHETLRTLNGKGGLIAVDRQGNYAMPFNTTGMFRGIARSGKEQAVALFKNEAL